MGTAERKDDHPPGQDEQIEQSGRLQYARSPRRKEPSQIEINLGRFLGERITVMASSENDEEAFRTIRTLLYLVAFVTTLWFAKDLVTVLMR